MKARSRLLMRRSVFLAAIGVLVAVLTACTGRGGGQLPPDKVAQFGKSNPMGRPAQPEELAPAYVYLASDADSSFVTGIVLQVMGGETTGG